MAQHYTTNWGMADVAHRERQLSVAVGISISLVNIDFPQFSL